MHPDEAYQNLEIIFNDFDQFCAQRGQVTEADTRVNIIDRILTEVLGWPSSGLGREDAVHRGYIDYVLSGTSGKKLIVVEAKREGITFDVPVSMGNTRYKLNSSIKSNEKLYEAINQAHYYAIEKGIRYAVVTNGYAWIIFRAIREDKPWREGHALVFSSAEVIKEKFKDFWNVLSWEALSSGSFEAFFSTTPQITRKLLRVLDKLHNPDQLLTRNRLHTQLHPLVNRVFGDITDQDQIEILQRCYVHSSTLRVADKNLEVVITDSVPIFAVSEGTVDTTPGRTDSGMMGSKLTDVMSHPESPGNGTVFLLLGGIGSGKSTFLKRFFQFVGKEFMDTKGCWFYISFLQPPSVVGLEDYVYAECLRQIRERYAEYDLESRDSILEAYSDEIERLNSAILAAEKLSEVDYQRRLSKYLEEWRKDQKEYVKAIVGLLRKKGKAVVFCVDNVDQLSPEYQNSIFLFSQRLSNELKSIIIVALREETFYSATIQRTFTAYTNYKYHISSPSFRILIGQRLQYARELLSSDDTKVRLVLKSGSIFQKDQIGNFLKIMEDSLFSRNRNIVRFIECISSGNMRMALNLFTRFLYSGSTDVDKMLGIVSRSGSYHVPFHEFAKSVILGDRRYYRESGDPTEILNIFDCGLERNSSHFTSMRILNFLFVYIGANSPEGRGYVEVSRLLDIFVSIFDNEEDFFRSADRLLHKALVEVDTRSTLSVRDSAYIRITSAGWYYLSFLSKSFSYLDLIYVDTPVNDEEIVQNLFEITRGVDTTPDTESHRRQKMQFRFERVRKFLSYLKSEEDKEKEMYNLKAAGDIFAKEITIPIIQQCEQEIQNIKTRISDVFNDDSENYILEIPAFFEPQDDQT